jgi:NADH:ubiquinone oxidoreductase subunit C
MAAALTDAFAPEALGVSADGIATVSVALAAILPTIERIRGELGFSRFVDLTAVDRLKRQDRFELVYLFYSMDQKAWVRIKTLADAEAPSVTPIIPGANWYEREVFDLFGIRFEGHPNLTRIMLPDTWEGHPLRRTEPLGSEPVDFTVTRRVYGHD